MTVFIIAFVIAAIVFAVAKSRGSETPNDPHAAPPKAPASPAGDDNPVIDADVVSMIRSGNMIDAIRMYRELHGTDLVTAKNAVEALSKTLRP